MSNEVFASLNTHVPGIEAVWAGHLKRPCVVIEAGGGTLSIHLSKDQAIRLANDLTDAVDQAETGVSS